MVLHRKEKCQISFRGLKIVIAALASIPLISLQLFSPYPLQVDSNSSTEDNNNNVVYAAAVDQVGGKPVAIKLNYAHFVPLTNSSQLHQVKVIVVYAVTPSVIAISSVQNAVMKVYASNGTLLRTTSFPDGLHLNATTGRAQITTTLADSTIKNITASVMLTDSSKSANYSNTLNVKLGLGQIIQP
jgi:hypothetical protein